jgi:hypothetical protein
VRYDPEDEGSPKLSIQVDRKRPVVVKKRRVYRNEDEAWTNADMTDMLSGNTDYVITPQQVQALSTALIADAQPADNEGEDGKAPPIIIDGGTTHHTTNTNDLLYDIQDCNIQVYGIAGKSKCQEKGKLALRLSNNNILILKDVLFVPSSTKNLIAEHRIAEEFIKTKTGHRITFRNMKGDIILEGKRKTRHGLFTLCYTERVAAPGAISLATRAVLQTNNGVSLDRWHQRLGHVNHESIVLAHNEKRMLGMKLPAKCTKTFCECCQEGKQKWKPVRWMKEKDDMAPGEYLHCDTIVMPKRPRSKDKYVQVFVDDKSTFGWIVLTSTNDNLHNVIRTVIERVKA